MRESRSAVLKMTRHGAGDEDVPEERRVRVFPQAYRDDVTVLSDFSPEVKEVAAAALSSVAKVVFVGDVGAGKTSLINRFCHSVFDSNYKATIGVDFEVEHFSILGVPFNLQIWDTAGQERFRSIASSYYRGAHAVVVVFDLSCLSSLANASRWMKEALVPNSLNDPHRLLVGTKKDLISSAVVAELEGHAVSVARTLQAELWLVSSQSGENVCRFFLRTAALAFDKSHTLLIRSHRREGVVKVGSHLLTPGPAASSSKSPRVAGCQGCHR